jgi:hypothetical protein
MFTCFYTLYISLSLYVVVGLCLVGWGTLLATFTQCRCFASSLKIRLGSASVVATFTLAVTLKLAPSTEQSFLEYYGNGVYYSVYAFPVHSVALYTCLYQPLPSKQSFAT